MKLPFFLLAATCVGLSPVRSAEPIPDDRRIAGVAIGCQAYTFNRFTAFETIEKTAAAGAKVIEFYPGQKLSPAEPDLKLHHTASPETLAKVQAKLKEHDIMAVAYGVVGLSKDEAECRKVFEFAKAMGIRVINTESVDALDTIEKLVKEYDIQVGFHNHPQRADNPDYKVWDPNYILEIVKDRDARIGACADTGHWMRSGLKPIDCLRILKGRIVSSHLKDLNAYGKGSHDVPYGTGEADMDAILDELAAQGFSGPASIEYEHNWENSLPEVTRCVEYLKKREG
ncbi:MAG: sugar phosphate isomerase/epimerase [Verrucomicrobiaceae bacterium]|nr:sugar phosphate isomerase/epimerase [Verrucomicrobiaceae bacterium]